MTQLRTDNRAAGNSTFAIGGVSCSADSLVVAESFVLRIKISGKNPTLHQAPKSPPIFKYPKKTPYQSW